jgi:hypothetical protein
MLVVSVRYTFSSETLGAIKLVIVATPRYKGRSILFLQLARVLAVACSCANIPDTKNKELYNVRVSHTMQWRRIKTVAPPRAVPSKLPH